MALWKLINEDIKTYAVTPLNEECGLIEWVDNLRTLRDLVIKLLRERGITPNVRGSLKALAIIIIRIEN
jgi:phosphatidylinositol kinase/protein kinase (PI-3  family)